MLDEVMNWRAKMAFLCSTEDDGLNCSRELHVEVAFGYFLLSANSIREYKPLF